MGARTLLRLLHNIEEAEERAGKMVGLERREEGVHAALLPVGLRVISAQKKVRAMASARSTLTHDLPSSSHSAILLEPETWHVPWPPPLCSHTSSTLKPLKESNTGYTSLGREL